MAYFKEQFQHSPRETGENRKNSTRISVNLVEFRKMYVWNVNQDRCHTTSLFAVHSSKGQADNKLKRMRKGAVAVFLIYYPRIYLGKLRRQRTSVRFATFRAKTRT